MKRINLLLLLFFGWGVQAELNFGETYLESLTSIFKSKKDQFQSKSPILMIKARSRLGLHTLYYRVTLMKISQNYLNLELKKMNLFERNNQYNKNPNKFTCFETSWDEQMIQDLNLASNQDQGLSKLSFIIRRIFLKDSSGKEGPPPLPPFPLPFRVDYSDMEYSQRSHHPIYKMELPFYGDNNEKHVFGQELSRETVTVEFLNAKDKVSSWDIYNSGFINFSSCLKNK